MPTQLLWLIPLLPFCGFLLNGLLGRKLPRGAVSGIALLFTAAPFALVLWLAATMTGQGIESVSAIGAPWIQVSGFAASFGLYVDHLTLIMLLVVTGVGFLIHVYSASYMAHEDGYWRFFAYLNLFMFFMLTLVLAESFLLMFVGWEGVGLASYLLIGFYFAKDSAAAAGKKAFIVNRIGDFGFLLAMFLMIAHFGSLSYGAVFGQIASHPELQGGFLTAIALLLVLGATGKSAQIPLYIWLPDAMEGPTPVSALIHAATMVTAGIYMVARSHVLFDRSPYALGVVAIIGCATAFFAATIGIVQTDIKRVLAYSTISQLGYMFMACGVAAYSAGIFHLVTHAFFKGLLFLAAGSVIHALSGEQDMRKMGGLRKKIPVTFWTMTAGVFAIAGFFPFSGFFSKDEILYQTFISPNPLGKLLWFVGLLTAGITSFYMFRLWYMTFFGEPQPSPLAEGQARAHGVHESSWVMLLPLVVLAILSVAGGWMGISPALGGHDAMGRFLAPVFAPALGTESPTPAEPTGHGLELALAAVSMLTALLGLYLADTFYRRERHLPAQFAAKASGLYAVLRRKYAVDEIYGAVIVAPLLVISRVLLWKGVDQYIVDGASSASASRTQWLGGVVRKMQSGNIRSYAGWLAAGAAAILLLSIFAFGNISIHS